MSKKCCLVSAGIAIALISIPSFYKAWSQKYSDGWMTATATLWTIAILIGFCAVIASHNDNDPFIQHGYDGMELN